MKKDSEQKNNMEYKDLYVPIEEDFYKKIKMDAKNAGVAVSSLISWMLFRGISDLHFYNPPLPDYDGQGGNAKEVHLRLSPKIHKKLASVGKSKGLTNKQLIPKILKMEYKKMKDYDMIRTRRDPGERRKTNQKLEQQIMYLSECTNIKKTDLILLMLCEYIMIVYKGRYGLPEEYMDSKKTT